MYKSVRDDKEFKFRQFLQHTYLSSFISLTSKKSAAVVKIKQYCTVPHVVYHLLRDFLRFSHRIISCSLRLEPTLIFNTTDFHDSFLPNSPYRHHEYFFWSNNSHKSKFFLFSCSFLFLEPEARFLARGAGPVEGNTYGCGMGSMLVS